MSANPRPGRRLVVAVVVSVWLAVVVVRGLQIVHWPWLWVLAPYWVALAGLVLYVVLCVGISLGLRVYLSLAARAERRRREQTRREFIRAVENSFLGGQGTNNRRPPR